MRVHRLACDPVVEVGEDRYRYRRHGFGWKRTKKKKKRKKKRAALVGL